MKDIEDRNSTCDRCHNLARDIGIGYFGSLRARPENYERFGSASELLETWNRGELLRAEARFERPGEDSWVPIQIFIPFELVKFESEVSLEAFVLQHVMEGIHAEECIR